jgi:2-phospho-L-lactate/phosphoenolpyruvate guanylyltransferase
LIFALLPVKDPRNAKQRLAGVLSAEVRERLARLLYEQTLAALSQASGIDRVVVVTSDPEITAHARRSGAVTIEENEQVSHSASADAACRAAMEMGAETALLIPIDVPLVTPADFERLATAGRSLQPGVVIVPSADGTGTNALARTPPDAIPSCFGPGSFRAHLAQARSRAVAADVLRLPGLMFDIDTPEDVAELLLRAPGSHVAGFLAGFLRSTCASK